MSKKLKLEEAQKKLDLLYPGKFTLISYSGYKDKCKFKWNSTGEIDSYWFFKFFLPTFKRFEPSKRKSEHAKIKLSFNERKERVKKYTNNAKLLEFDEITQKCKVEWPNGEISNHSYSSLLSTRSRLGPPSTKEERTKATMIKRYGFDHPSKVPSIALKIAKKINNSSIKYHWETNEELVCQGSYEAKTVDYLNNNKIKYKWQCETFILPNNSTYRPDLYLIDDDMWIEIKGYLRPDAKIKWELFTKIKPNSEMWTKEILKSKNIL